LLQAKVALERQGITLKFYRNQRLPALDVAGSYGHTSGGFEFNDTFRQLRQGDREFWSLGAAFSIPLGNKNAREQYRRGKVEADQLVLELKKLEETVLIEVDEAMSLLRTSRERIQSTAAARGYAEEALTAETKKLDSGKSTSYDVLQFQRDLITARTAEIQALSDYNKALADLYQAEGTTLERKQIKVEPK
jgi:outer membrane protein TolC